MLQTIITVGAAVSAVSALIALYNKLYKWLLRQKEQDKELAIIREENTVLTYGVLACLKGLAEQGCNGPVHDAINKIEKHLNLKAHGQKWG